jgi:hypothetical protein
MKIKLNLSGNFIAKCFFGIALMLGIFCTSSSNAQLVNAGDPHRDSTLVSETYTRAQIMAMDSHVQSALFEAGGFVISDLFNASYSDFLNATSLEVFISEQSYYDAPWQKQQMYITDPDKFKIYKPTGH